MREISEADLGWLAGMIDGEGNISCGLRRNPNGESYLDVKVRISATDVRNTAKLGKIYENMNLVFFHSLMNKNRSDWKTGLNIEVARQGSTRKLLETVLPYLVGKQALAQSIINLISYVQGLPGSGNGQRRSYAQLDEFKTLMEKCETQRKWYFDPSTTTRKAGVPISLDGIV